MCVNHVCECEYVFLNSFAMCVVLFYDFHVPLCGACVDIVMECHVAEGAETEGPEDSQATHVVAGALVAAVTSGVNMRDFFLIFAGLLIYLEQVSHILLTYCVCQGHY